VKKPVQSELFASGPAAPIDLAPGADALAAVAGRLPADLRMGTSSWTFPGWEGILWDRATTPAVLGRHGLPVYARHPLLRCVGVDRGYYQPVPRGELELWAGQTPPDFRFVLKADRRLVFPGGPGSDPDLYLNPAWAAEEVVGPAMEHLGERLGAVLFQFPPLSPAALGGARGFSEALYRFLDALPAGAPAVVEIRTPQLLTGDYAQALRHGRASHGYVVHGEMVSLRDQATRIPPAPGGVTLIRWMLQPGYRYADARAAWAPFRELRRPDVRRRDEVADLVRATATAGAPPLVVVNNKAEGSAPLSIAALASSLAGNGSESPATS
jgi:uncharacterized protein YecE (DUF72 family)